MQRILRWVSYGIANDISGYDMSIIILAAEDEIEPVEVIVHQSEEANICNVSIGEPSMTGLFC